MTPNVQTTPEGFNSLTPHLVIKDAAKAIDFYKSAFGAEEIMRIPMPGGSDRLMHACLRIGNSMVMMADEFPGFSVAPDATGNTPVTIHLYVPDVDATIARAVEHGATITMPASDMFWGDRYGQIVDPFGHRWSVATHMYEPTAEQMAEGAKMMCSEHAASAG